MKDLMKRNTKVALALCLAVLGTAVKARADCQNVFGRITETQIPAPNDPLGRSLANVDGVLNGANTAVITSSSPDGLNATSLDVFVTTRGDLLTATGAVTLTPIPGNSSDFTLYVTLTITGGSGKYTGATGTLTYQGQANVDAAGTFHVYATYRGSVCGPNVKADGN
jgi:hypothetical protein